MSKAQEEGNSRVDSYFQPAVGAPRRRKQSWQASRPQIGRRLWARSHCDSIRGWGVARGSPRQHSPPNQATVAGQQDGWNQKGPPNPREASFQFKSTIHAKQDDILLSASTEDFAVLVQQMSAANAQMKILQDVVSTMNNSYSAVSESFTTQQALKNSWRRRRHKSWLSCPCCYVLRPWPVHPSCFLNGLEPNNDVVDSSGLQKTNPKKVQQQLIYLK